MAVGDVVGARYVVAFRVERVHQALGGEPQVGREGEEIEASGHVGQEDEDAGSGQHHRQRYRTQKCPVLEEKTKKKLQIAKLS